MESIDTLSGQELIDFVSGFKDCYDIMLSVGDHMYEYGMCAVELEIFRLELWWYYCKHHGIAPKKSLLMRYPLPDYMVDGMKERAISEGGEFR